MGDEPVEVWSGVKWVSIDQMREAFGWPKPTRVEDKLPEDGSKILCYSASFGWFLIQDWEKDVYVDGSGASLGFTHWLPLPPAPQDF